MEGRDLSAHLQSGSETGMLVSLVSLVSKIALSPLGLSSDREPRARNSNLLGPQEKLHRGMVHVDAVRTQPPMVRD